MHLILQPTKTKTSTKTYTVCIHQEWRMCLVLKICINNNMHFHICSLLQIKVTYVGNALMFLSFLAFCNQQSSLTCTLFCILLLIFQSWTCKLSVHQMEPH